MPFSDSATTHARLAALLAVALLGISLTGCRARAAQDPELHSSLLASGFASPVELVAAPDGSGRLFVVDQVGAIWILQNGKRLTTPFLDLRDRLVKLLPFYDERGLLALAFHPDFAHNGRFFVYYSAPLRPGLSSSEWDHTTRVSEFRVSAQAPNRADPSSETVILSIDKPGYNDEGGALAFGPDGFLYIGTGDSVHDPSSQAGRYGQDVHSLLGKVLRIDVNAPGTDVSTGEPTRYHIPPDNPLLLKGGRPEIFAYGFRNPYRMSFDAGTSRLFVSDVGQALMEELDLVQPGGNYGWPIREGSTCFDTLDWARPLPRCLASGLTDPILEYPHAGKASAIVGGFIYRGAALPGLQGAFLFGDWGRGPTNLFAGSPNDDRNGMWAIQALRVAAPGLEGSQLLGVMPGPDGEPYLLVKEPGVGPGGNTGAIYRLVP